MTIRCPNCAKIHDQDAGSWYCSRCYDYFKRINDSVAANESKEEKRPPLGVKPRWLWLEERATELCQAIGRHHKLEHMGRIKTLAFELIRVLEEREMSK